LDDCDGVGLDLGFGVDISLPSMPRTIIKDGRTKNCAMQVKMVRETFGWRFEAEVDATNRAMTRS